MHTMLDFDGDFERNWYFDRNPLNRNMCEQTFNALLILRTPATILVHFKYIFVVGFGNLGIFKYICSSNYFKKIVTVKVSLAE